MEGLLDFFTREAGQRRTRSLLDFINTDVAHYVPPNLRGPLGLLGEVNPVNDIYQAGGDLRDGDYVGAATNTAAAALPLAGAVAAKPLASGLAQSGDDASRAIMDALTMYQAGGAQALDTVVERANQRGPVPTMYSNPLLGDIEDYAGVHRAPGRNTDNASLDDLTNLFPDDIYDRRVAAQYYGHMEDPVADQEMIDLFARMRGNPDAKIPVYRAVPSNVDAGVNPGDWVTPSRRYAVGHGEGPLGGDYKIVETEARAGDLFTDANSIFEFGYDPAPSLTPAQQQAQDVLGLLGQGRASEVTDDMMGAADDLYLAQNYDLPLDEASRMQRAQEMGLVDTQYHATMADIKGFEPSQTGLSGRGVYTGDYADDIEDYARASAPDSDGLNIIPLVAPSGDTYARNIDWQNVTDADPAFSYNATTQETIDGFRRASDKMSAEGFSGVRSQPGERVTFDPSNLRSRFARFDPRLSHLRNLSAGVGGVGLLSALTPQEEEEMRRYLEQQQ